MYKNQNFMGAYLKTQSSEKKPSKIRLFWGKNFLNQIFIEKNQKIKFKGKYF
jgi:hypothetical protein